MVINGKTGKSNSKQKNMTITKRNKYPIINSYPWRCNGTKDNWHPEIENYDRCCDFPGCQEKCLEIPYSSKSFLRKTIGLSVTLIAFTFLIPMIFEAYRYSNYAGQRKFTYGGSTAFAPIRDSEIEKSIEENLSKTLKIPGLNLIYSQNPGEIPGTASGIKRLIEGELSFANASRPLRSEEGNKARDRGLTIKQTPVAIDGIAVFVNPDLNVSQLTVEQVRDLFTGRITNWRQVGGPSIPVVPISFNSKSPEGDIADFFHRDVIGENSFADNYQKLKTPTEAMQCVSSSKHCRITLNQNLTGAIGYASASSVCDQEKIQVIALRNNGGSFINPCIDKKVNTSVFDGSYPITRKLFVITEEDNKDAQRVGEAYSKMLQSRKGQELLEQAGFAPIFGNK